MMNSSGTVSSFLNYNEEKYPKFSSSRIKRFPFESRTFSYSALNSPVDSSLKCSIAFLEPHIKASSHSPSRSRDGMCPHA